MKDKKVKGKFVAQQNQNIKQIKGISPVGKKVIIGGILLIVLGFFILTKTDPAGQNFASKISPFLILGGYITIGIGIILPEKDKNSLPKTN